MLKTAGSVSLRKNDSLTISGECTIILGSSSLSSVLSTMGEYGVEDNDLTFVLGIDRQFSFEQRPRPKPVTPKHVVVKVIATGICGSDVSIIAFPLLIIADERRGRYITGVTEPSAISRSPNLSSLATNRPALLKNVARM